MRLIGASAVFPSCRLTAWASPAARVRGEHLRYRANDNARGAADLRRDSAVGCKPLLARTCFSLDVRLHNLALQAIRPCVVGITPAVDRDVGPLPAVPLPRTGSRPLRRVAAL